MYEFPCFPQKFIKQTSYSDLKDNSDHQLSPDLQSMDLSDFSCIYAVIHRKRRFLLLRLYLYKTSKEQLKANSA